MHPEDKAPSRRYAAEATTSLTLGGGCHAHGRRGIVAALRLGDARALEGLELYGTIFHIDAESKRLGETLAQRFERRARESAQAVDALRAWVTQRRQDVEPKSALGQAVGYLERQWPRLTEFLRDPRMELTNNEVESDLRPWVLNRKTWLFVGNERSARRAADALTLITTCKKMGIQPRAYLRFALEKLLAGEREAAKRAAERIRARLAELRGREEDVELLYRIADPWMRTLFVALCRRYGLKPYRERGRRYSTVIVRAPETFHKQTLWPEFTALSDELAKELKALTDRVIREAIHNDVTEPAEASAPKALTAASTARGDETAT